MKAALQKCIINESNQIEPTDGFPVKRWKEIEIVFDTDMDELRKLYDIAKPGDCLSTGYRLVNLDNLEILVSGGEIMI